MTQCDIWFISNKLKNKWITSFTGSENDVITFVNSLNEQSSLIIYLILSSENLIVLVINSSNKHFLYAITSSLWICQTAFSFATQTIPTFFLVYSCGNRKFLLFHWKNYDE